MMDKLTQALLKQAHLLMQRLILFSVKASMLTVDIGFFGVDITLVELTIWFTAQAQTVQRGQLLQQLDLVQVGVILAFGLMGHIYITLTPLFLIFIIGVERRTVTAQSLGVQPSRQFQQHIIQLVTQWFLLIQTDTFGLVTETTTAS
jgi:hypothetical protein